MNILYIRALEAAKRLGFTDQESKTLLKALTGSSRSQNKLVRDLSSARSQKESLDKAWDDMSFSEWSQRKKDGTLPPTK